MAGDLRGVEFWGVGLDDDDGEVELSLGLSIGGSSRKAAMGEQENRRPDPDMRSVQPETVYIGGSGDRYSSAPPAVFNSGDAGDPLDPQRRREVHALRRQEARKKRDEKQQRKGICRGRSAAAADLYGGGAPARTCSLDDRMLLEAQEYRTRERDREAREEEEETCRLDRRAGGNHDRALDLTPNHVPDPDPDPNPSPNLNSKPNANYNASPSPNPVPYGAHPFPVMPMQQYPYHHLQYVPFPNGFGFPYVMPHAVPAVSPLQAGDMNPERNVFQPVACRAFQPFPLIVDPNGASPAGNGSSAEEMNAGIGEGVGINRTASSTGSMGSSSSAAVSDYHSGSLQGGSSSCDTRNHSSHVLEVEKPQPPPPPQPFSQATTTTKQQGGQSDHSSSSTRIESTTRVDEEPPLARNGSAVPCSTSPRRNSTQSTTPRKQLEGSVSVDKPHILPTTAEKSKGEDDDDPPPPPPPPPQDSSLPQMPCVSTTGNGPNGKTITGFLYRYTKTEVSIMCVCHGSSFTPAEFVKHAGGTDISHPLKHIVVVSS